MAVLFTRKGNKFRGNQNFAPKKSAKLSFKYVAQQIDIVSPKLIITLGNLAFEVVNKHFDLGFKNPKITKVVNELDGKYFIEKEGTKILPNFHPAAHVDPETQAKIWRQMWEVMEI